MRITLNDINNYVKNAPEHTEHNYQIVVSARDKKPIEPEIKAITQFLARQRKHNPDLLWYIGLSKHHSKGLCKKYHKRTGKRGRPPIRIKGKPAIPHVHIFLMSRNKQANVKVDRDRLLRFIDKRTRHYNNLKQFKSSAIKGCGFIKYINRQSEHIFATPDYNWGYFLSVYYDDS